MRVGALGLPATDVVLSRFVDRVRDQSIAETCVGESLASGLHVANEGKGAHPSHRGIWTGARVRERAAKNTPIADVGCEFADAIDAVTEVGIYAEDDRDDDPSFMNLECDWGELQDAIVVPQDAVQVIAGGAAYIAASLAEGRPCAFGMGIDDSYLSYSGNDVWRGLIGPSRGNHAQLVVDFYAGPRAFLVLNSWSTQWGRGGYALIAAEFFDDPNNVFDVHSIGKGPVLG